MARILIVDDELGSLEWMHAALTSAGHEVRSAPSAQRALGILDQWTPDLALLDVLMPETDGWVVSRIISRYRVPIIFTTIVRGQGEAILRGSTGFLRKPITPAQLRAEVHRVLGGHREKATILLVDDDPDIRLGFTSILNPTFEVIEAENGAHALELLVNRRVSLVITDVRMPVMDGRELVRRIRQDARWADLPVLVQTGDREAARLPLWTELQVEQVMTKDAFIDWLLARIDQRLAEPGVEARP